jgi:hypothetical protein
VIALFNLIHLCAAVLCFEQLNGIFDRENGALTLVLITDNPQDRNVNVLKRGEIAALPKWQSEGIRRMVSKAVQVGLDADRQLPAESKEVTEEPLMLTFTCQLLSFLQIMLAYGLLLLHLCSHVIRESEENHPLDTMLVSSFIHVVDNFFGTVAVAFQHNVFVAFLQGKFNPCVDIQHAIGELFEGDTVADAASFEFVDPGSTVVRGKIGHAQLGKTIG